MVDKVPGAFSDIIISRGETVDKKKWHGTSFYYTFYFLNLIIFFTGKLNKLFLTSSKIHLYKPIALLLNANQASIYSD